MYQVYVLKSLKDLKLYIGCTSNLSKRINEHNAGKVRSTKSRLPFTVVYSEGYSDKYEAYKMERFYKTAKGKKVLWGKIK